MSLSSHEEVRESSRHLHVRHKLCDLMSSSVVFAIKSSKIVRTDCLAVILGDRN